MLQVNLFVVMKAVPQPILESKDVNQFIIIKVLHEKIEECLLHSEKEYSRDGS